MAEETIELTNNLENLLSPFCYEQESALPKTNPEVPGGMYLSGFISQDCTWGCCFNHSVIKCFPVDKYFEDNHTNFPAHSSSACVAVSSSSYTFTGGHITCATELAIHNLRISSGMRKLLLGISYASSENNNRDGRGAVVLFDPIRCAPMKWIEIPDPVSSITVLSHFEEGGSNRPFFNETMMAMVGIAAVGLRGGSVIIIDLGLDDPSLSSVSTPECRNASDLTYRLLTVNPHEYVIATKRHKAVSKRNLISLRFTNEPDEEMIADAFHYCKPNGESVVVLHKNSVAVTCLEYVPAIGSLLVGFTCGGFQIWRVNNMELQFSSEPVFIQSNEPAHVFGFSFQQPVDDPKNYCYIWVMYGNKSAECTNTHVELHSLLYERKNYIENFGFVYDGFKQCAKRMSFPLLDDFLSTDSENEELDSIRSSARPIRIWTQPESDLMYCAWEVGRGGIFYLGAFDLNQWYSNHTKEHIFYNPDSGLCPYWVALPVEIQDVSNFMMDVRIMPKSLMRWENPHTKLDVHLYPASVSFRAICLTNTGVSAFEHFGVQEKLVRIVLKDGPSLMIQPENIKNSFSRYGLEPVFPHIYGEHLSKKDQDRFFILTVLLENRRIPAIIRLASVWLDGSYANVGCTIDLIIDWIGGYMVALRGGADEHWQNLFEFADETLPPETVRYINFSNFAWKSLHRLLLTLMGPTEVYSVRKQELENMEFGLGKLVQYSAALLMMFKARLLPECDKTFIKTLTDYYEQRRIDAKTALESCAYIDTQLKKSHPLMIDHLMDGLMAEEDLREEWHVEEGQHCYPPQHVGYLVNMFMFPDADTKAISRVFMYFLLDLTFLSQNADATHNSIVERKVRGDFQAVMDSTGEEYQEIYVLWLLDKGIPNEVLVHLKENDRLYQNDGLPWCAATVALTAAGYENDVAELLLKSCPRNLARLLFSLMTSSVSKYSSLAELMISSNLSFDEDLLQQFFEISETRERLAEFIRTKSKELPQRVKTALLTFLENSDSVRRLSQLLMFYVHTEDYKKLEQEFARVRGILRDRNLSDSDKKLWKFQENYINHLLSTTKSSMVQQFLRLQSHQNVRAVQTTISIKAVPATDDAPAAESPDRLKNESRLPFQLRRLKHSESIINDPLSPLRRYAGRIQNAVSTSQADCDDEKETRPRRFSSRKSFSRRISLSTTQHSFGNVANGTFNETLPNEDGLNTTSRNSHIDLLRLLKTPAVNHRLENRRRSSFYSLNQTMSQGIPEEVSQIDELPIHSIMKEADPSKPKVVKKVELRFENLSLSSEEEDGKNATIYEDADENLEEENENHPAATSFNSPVDRSMFGSESVGEFSLMQADVENVSDIDEIHQNVPSQNEQTTSVQADEKRLGTIEVTGQEETQQGLLKPPTLLKTPADDDHVENSQGIPEQVGQIEELSIHSSMKEYDPSKPEDGKKIESKNLSLPSEEGDRKNTSIYEDADKNLEEESENRPADASFNSAIDRSIFGSESAGEFSLIQADVDPENVSHINETLQTVPSQNERLTTVQAGEKLLGTIEVTGPEETQSGVAEPSTSGTKLELKCETVEVHKVRKSRKRELVLVDDPSVMHSTSIEEPESEPSKKQKRGTSRSVTPTRDLSLEQVFGDETSVQHSTSTEEPENKHNRKHKRGASRSVTPTRELSLEQVLPDETSGEHSASIEEPEIKPSRKHKRGTSRSLTPTRELSLEQDSDEINKPLRRSARTSVSINRELYEDESEENEERRNLRRSSRVSRSRTPTRDLPGEQDMAGDEPLKKIPTTRRSLRSTRSTTPTRDSVSEVDLDDSESTKTTRRTTRNTRSKTPTRSLELTPPRDPSDEQDLVADETLKKIPTTRRSLRSTRSTTPTRDAVTEVDLDDSESTKSTRRTTRNTRSKTPTRIMEPILEDSPAKALRRETRASKTPSRDVSADEGSKVEESTDTKAAKKRGKSLLQSLVTPEPTPSSSSFVFEITQEDMEEESEHADEVQVPETSKTANPGKIRKARKRGLKYLHHHQDLSTVIEDSETDRSEASVFEATMIPSTSEPPKPRKIKGIKMRPSEEPSEPESGPTKPTKRRKAAALVVDFDEDDDFEAESQVSSRSTRSTSSRRSNTSTKAKTSRRKTKKSTA